MAKKKATRRGDFILAAEVRDILTKNPGYTGKETLTALKTRFPNRSINESSFGVAFSTARGKLGLRKGKKVRRRKPGAAQAQQSNAVMPDISALQAARKYVAQVGDAEVAITAIKQLQTLQIG